MAVVANGTSTSPTSFKQSICCSFAQVCYKGNTEFVHVL